MHQVLSPKSEFAMHMASVYPKLSKSHQKIADFIITKPFEVVAMSIDGLSQASDTSNATVTRFVRAAGYENYSVFREKIAADLQNNPTVVLNDQGNVVDKINDGSELGRYLSDNISNINYTITNLDKDQADAFIQALLTAQRVFILGMGASHYAADLLQNGLELYGEKNVYNLLLRGPTPSSYNLINTVNSNDVVLAITMPRYSAVTSELTAIARKRGAKILAITDSQTSPIVNIADHILFASAYNSLMPNSPTAIFAVADAIMTALAAQRPDIVAKINLKVPAEAIVI